MNRKRGNQYELYRTYPRGRAGGKLLAITRVHKEEHELTDIFGCIYKKIPDILSGEVCTFAKGSCSCMGFDHNTGLVDEMPNTPSGFGLFLSKGSDQQWTPPGERFKCDPETAEAMFHSEGPLLHE